MHRRSSTTPMLAATLLVLAATAVVAFVVRPTPASVAEGHGLSADAVAAAVVPEIDFASASPSSSPSPSASPSPKPSASASPKPTGKPTPMMTAASTRAARRVGVPILCYHHISPPAGSSPELHVSPPAFARQMASLKAKGYHAVTLRQVFDFWAYNKPIPKKPIVITFDDGWRTVYTGAAPVLKRYGWPGVVNEVVWAIDANYGMTQGQLMRLVKRGWEINSHTVGHAMLSSLSWSALMEQLVSSRKRLAHKLHTTIDFLCYPGGDYNATVIKGVRQAGYKGAMSIWGGLGRWQERWELRRIMVTEAGFTIPGR